MTELPEGLKELDIHAVLHSLGEGVTLANAEGRIVFSNEAADRILGVSATDATPDDWATYYGVFLPDRETPFPTEEYPLVRALRGEHTREVEMFVRNPNVPDGVLISVTGRPLTRGEATIGAAVVFHDITASRRMQQDLAAANESLRHTQRMKDELAAFLVHDLKGPLTSILVSAELLRMSDHLDAEDRTSVEDIHESTRTVHRMVLDLLDIQVAEDGALSVEAEAVSVGETLREVLDTAGPRAGAAGQEIVPGAELDRLVVWADPGFLRRILQNLVDNCLKYGPSGGTIRVDGSDEEDEAVVIRVRDEGPGVPVELRERIFDRYAQVERDARSRTRDSRGLGLRFCRVASEAQGGRIWVEDNEPAGACFAFTLPRGKPMLSGE